MKVIYGIGNVKTKIRRAVLAIGVFDGIHRGHQKLINKAVIKAKSIKGQAIVMTFFPHPVQVLNPKKYMPLIVSLPHRLKLIEKLGVAVCIVVRFTKKFSRLSPPQFIKRYLGDCIKPCKILVGDDFRFGKDRRGTLDLFEEAGRKYGFSVEVVIPVKSRKGKIGSTQIRRLIAEGELKSAESLLGRRVAVIGIVEKGDARGQSLGYPTANIYPKKEVVVPIGVYAVNVQIGRKKYKGTANVGHRPSFRSGKNGVNIEVHIFRFNRKIYGREIMIEFVQKIREERTFSNKKKLIEQLKKDETKARLILRI